MTALSSPHGMTLVRKAGSVNWRFIDWIWTVRGSVPLAPGQSAHEAFASLDPLFRVGGTTYDRSGDTLTFRKQDQAAQDKMSIFDSGVLLIEGGALRYRMFSRMLLFCFIMPFVFVGFGQLTVAIGKLEQPSAEEAAAAAKKAEKKDVVRAQNPIDKWLGAPAPDKPKKDAPPKKNNKHSPTTAYVLAGIFAALYLIGRILEDRLVRSLFRKRLNAA